jgi:hypothetical protein
MNQNNEKLVSNWIPLISTVVSVCCVIFTATMCYLAYKANQLTYKANQLTEKAISESTGIAKEANSLAKKANDKTERFAIINAEVQWDSIRDSHDKIDISLQEWEKNKNLKKKGKIIESRNELDRELRLIDAPDYIKHLYIKRFEKYQIMKNVAKQYEPFLQRMSNIDFSLPEPPRLPSVTIIGGGNVSIGGGGNVSIGVGK